MKTWGLHGFIGRPEDFNGLKTDITAVDYLKIPELSSKISMPDWGKNFCKYVSGENNFLIGYSQGGRLALQAVRANPKLWSGLVLISANPGISEGEKTPRLENDKIWAKKFSEDEFDRTLKLWNQQPVFRGSQNEPVRKESDYSREELSQCLLNWSVANQEDFRNFLREAPIPVLFISGDRDFKYKQTGEELNKMNEKIKHVNVPETGHRVIFDNPSAVAAAIQKFKTENI